MKLSTKTRYGTRAMLYLALHYGKGPSTTREIAEDQALSAKYLEQLLSTLRATGLIRSTRGNEGGYLLARSPDQISVSEIYVALEGADTFIACTANPGVCERSGTCITRGVWAEAYDAFMGVLDSLTLQDLALRARHQDGTQSSYSI